MRTTSKIFYKKEMRKSNFLPELNNLVNESLVHFFTNQKEFEHLAKFFCNYLLFPKVKLR